MIFITAKFRVKPGDANRWPEIAAPFTEATRAEPGCLWFEWSRSLDDPTGYVLIEAFRDNEAALPPHLVETPRIINFSLPQDGWSELGEMAADPG